MDIDGIGFVFTGMVSVGCCGGGGNGWVDGVIIDWTWESGERWDW